MADRAKLIARLNELVSEEDLPGEWTATVANARCAEYAHLLGELAGGWPLQQPEEAR
jgi:hypothetical protein